MQSGLCTVEPPTSRAFLELSWSFPPALSPASNEQQGWRGTTHPGSAPAKKTRQGKEEGAPLRPTQPSLTGRSRGKKTKGSLCRKLSKVPSFNENGKHKVTYFPCITWQHLSGSQVSQARFQRRAFNEVLDPHVKSAPEPLSSRN